MKELSRWSLACLLAGLGFSACAFRAPARTPGFAERHGNRRGLVAAPADLSHLPAAAAAHRRRLGAARLAAAEAPLPEKWSARDEGWVSPVKSQGVYGTCWTFATMAALETGILKASGGAVTNDFSENHMARHDVGFAWGFDDGGNNAMAAALLAAWRDPVEEADDPYPNPDATATLPAVHHVQRIVWLPERTVTHTNAWDDIAAANEVLKRGLLAYGALAVDYYHAANHYNPLTGAHYLDVDQYQPSAGSDGGHAVTLIGWDDNYSTNNFRSGLRPPGNGAFLVKNSWGNAWNTDQGCSWISYYDDEFCGQVAAAYPAPEATNNYGRVYEYDPCGQTQTYNIYESSLDEEIGGKEDWCANVFTTSATGIVAAVGFYAMSYDMAYTLRVYTDCAATPNSGTLVCEQTGVVAEPGYATIPLQTEVPLDEPGLKFAVVLKLAAPDCRFPLPVENTIADYCTATANPGESFYSPDGETWTDFQHFETSGNFCVKAYTKFGSDGEPARELIAASEPFVDGVVLLEPATVAFRVTPVADEGPLSYTWLWDGVALADGTAPEYTLHADFAAHGAHTLTCRVSDGASVSLRTWSVVVNANLHVACTAAAGGDGSAAKPFASFAEAFAVAVEGDVVRVGPGMYTELVEVPSVRLTVVSDEGPAATIVDRDGQSCCYYGVYNTETLFAGFTLQNGSAQYGGGALYGTLSNCVVRACEAYYGGAVAGATFVDGVISNNVALWGGGAYSSVVRNSLIVQNEAWYTMRNSGMGGGAYDSDLTGCTVSANWADTYGGGVYLDTFEYGLFNSILAGNGNTSSAYGDADLYEWGPTDVDRVWIGGNPRFVDIAAGDWRLAPGSPCIDVGDNGYVTEAHDLAGEARIAGAYVDLGCYEYRFDVPGWPVPEVACGASAADEAAAVADAARAAGLSAATSEALTSVSAYAALADWAVAHDLSAADLAAARAPLASAAFGADGLVDWAASDLRIGLFRPGDARWTLTLELPGYDGTQVLLPLLPCALGVKGAANLEDGLSAEGLSLACEPDFEHVDLTVTTQSPKRFLQVLVR